MSAVRYPVVELRQYTLRPGQRDVLIDLFDREFVESQEADGMAIVGQFRDLDDTDRFTWIRGFASMPARARALASFYGGPAWKAHSAAANATMIDSDNVLLLRPVTARSGFPPPAAARPPAGHGTAAPSHTPAAPSRVLVTLYYRDRPPGPSGAHRGRSHAAGMPANGARREHLPRAAGPHRRERLRLARPFPQPSASRRSPAPDRALRRVAR
jgi:hypothetical protein